MVNFTEITVGCSFGHCHEQFQSKRQPPITLASRWQGCSITSEARTDKDNRQFHLAYKTKISRRKGKALVTDTEAETHYRRRTAEESLPICYEGANILFGMAAEPLERRRPLHGGAESPGRHITGGDLCDCP